MQNEREFKNVTAYRYIGRAECLVLKAFLHPDYISTFSETFGDTSPAA